MNDTLVRTLFYIQIDYLWKEVAQVQKAAFDVGVDKLWLLFVQPILLLVCQTLE